MTKPKPKRQGRKTLEKRKRMLESKPDMLREDAAGTLAEDVQRQPADEPRRQAVGASGEPRRHEPADTAGPRGSPEAARAGRAR